MTLLAEAMKDESMAAFVLSIPPGLLYLLVYWHHWVVISEMPKQSPRESMDTNGVIYLLFYWHHGMAIAEDYACTKPKGINNF